MTQQVVHMETSRSEAAGKRTILLLLDKNFESPISFITINSNSTLASKTFNLFPTEVDDNIEYEKKIAQAAGWITPYSPFYRYVF